MNRLVRRAILGWQAWRSRRQLHRAYPELAQIQKRREACRKAHKRGVSSLEKQAREIVHAALAGRKVQ